VEAGAVALAVQVDLVDLQVDTVLVMDPVEMVMLI
jgi:hypothetical protein